MRINAVTRGDSSHALVSDIHFSNQSDIRRLHVPLVLPDAAQLVNP